MDDNYWQNRYDNQQTGWDIGYISTPIKTYFDKIEDKSCKILIPGCGNAHEATYLWENGFKNVYLCDWANSPLKNFAAQNPTFPKEQLLHIDFFTIEDTFDYVIEQTFFCALPPSRRTEYATKMSEIILKGGKLVGLLFGIEFDREGPPFGGTKEEYRPYFEPHFSSISMEPCLNSIPPRLGRELFIELIK